MNSTLGDTGVLLGFAAAVVGVVVIAVGLVRGRESTIRNGQIYAPVILLGGLIATAAMEHALITHDFSLAYVADNNSRSTPLLYSITGMWSALQGSILLWGVILGGYATAMVWRFRKRGADRLVAWATLVVYVVAGFFFMLMLGPSDPFQRITGAIPVNGNGPNVLLQDNPLVAFHPPMLYLGFVGFTLPFAFAVASLITGRLDEDWQSETRRWTLFAWGFLTIGIILGMWWSYQVLGWGGFWAWDPVENASFLPWLCGTAYLHSVMVQQRRGLLPRLEPLVGHRHLQPDHPGHLPDPFRGDPVGPCLLELLDHRPAAPRLLRSGGGGRRRPHRLARRSAAVSRGHRRSAQSGGGVPR